MVVSLVRRCTTSSSIACRIVVPFVLGAALWDCGREVAIRQSATGDGTGGEASASSVTGSSSPGEGGNGAAGAGGAAGSCGDCTPGPTQCTNCVDDDMDGLVDAWDTECTSPMDDDESSFSLGIPGWDGDPCKRDCHFDGNPGSGDDDCFEEVSCYLDASTWPDCVDATPQCLPPSQKCVDFCLGVTPNGCDCFGCCDVALADGSAVTVLLFDGCTEEGLLDPSVCPPCTQLAGCYNPCDHCEYCLGMTTLPADCPSGGTQGCAPGQQACDPTTPCCPGQYCLTGCCIPMPG